MTPAGERPDLVRVSAGSGWSSAVVKRDPRRQWIRSAPLFLAPLFVAPLFVLTRMIREMNGNH